MPNIVRRTCGLSSGVSSTIFLSFSIGVQLISSTFYIKQSSAENIIYNVLMLLHGAPLLPFLSFSWYAAASTVIYPNLPFAVQKRLDTAVMIPRMSISMRIPSAESLMQRFPYHIHLLELEEHPR